jgi:hypothetical protein
MTNGSKPFRKKPVEIQAMRLLASETGESARLVAAWCGGSVGGTYDDPHVLIDTLEGTMRAAAGDWVIRGVKGEHYPCKDDIFRETYEAVDG